jgi:DNA-binding NarL/FixJ family response regulator
MHGTTRIEVMIVEEDEFMRAGLRTLLSGESDVCVVAEAATSAEAIRQCTRLSPHVVVLDGSLADSGGLVESCRALRAHARRTRILVLLERVEPMSVLAAVLAGADGCLAKSSRLDDVRRLVRAVASGEAALDGHVTRILLDHLRRQPARADDRGAPLSHAECRVLQLVAAGKTNREIASALAVSEKTIKNWLSHAFGKLHVTRRAQAAVRFTLPGGAATGEPREPAQLRQARKLA